ncbi:PAS domain S-box protein [Kovacikia minuta CCNUW1]|uniref:sensor histidine kinase n=1 Tax=Kovacikia minuta TaxID=2931930 RepID=UPI001CCDDE4C|nr:ATP-binding protein [Kovacikia minuta]UBF24667.1 PAS domain S-box protein [Kovacikia minuta CCNUW1]
MRRLTLPDQATLRLAQSDFLLLFQALHRSIGGGSEWESVIFWGYDRALCKDLQHVWQQSLAQYSTPTSPLEARFPETIIPGQPESLASQRNENPNGTHRSTSGLSPNFIFADPETISTLEDGISPFRISNDVGQTEAVCRQLHAKVAHLPEPLSEERMIYADGSPANLLVLAASLQIWIQVKPVNRETPTKIADSTPPPNSPIDSSAPPDDRPWQAVLSCNPEEIARLLRIPAIAVLLPSETRVTRQKKGSLTILRQFWATLLQLPPSSLEDQFSAATITPPVPSLSIDFFLRQAPIGILQLGLDGGISKANLAFCQLIGYTETELRHLDNQSISFPQDFVAEVRLIQQLVDGGCSQQTLRKRYLCQDGSLLWAEVKLSLVGEAETGERSVFAFVTDLSAQILAEQEILQSREREAVINDISTQIRTKLDFQTILQIAVERLRLALDSDRVIAYQLFPDYSGICLAEDIAPTYPRMLGQKFSSQCIPPAYLEAYQRGRIWSVADIHSSELAECFQEMLQQFRVHSLMTTAVVSMDDALKPQNRTLWGLLVVHHCRGPRQWTKDEKQLMQAVANLVATALEQAQLLQHLQLHTQELENRECEQRLSAEHFRSFLEKSTDVFVEYDTQLRYLSINPAGCAFLGLPSNQVIGKTNRELLGSTGENLETLIQHAFDTGTKVFVDHEFHLPTGVRVFEIVYAPVANSTGTVQRVIGIARDVTELKQHWQRLETQNHQLTETTRLKEEFVATTSHELRTPLTAILGFSNVLLQEFFGKLNPKQKDYLERIHTSGQHLLDLINDILDLSRLEADRLELDLQTIFVPDVCEGVISLIQERTLNQGLCLEVDLDPQVDWIVADPRRLKQMLLNLLTNAVKFTQEGTIGLKVYRQTNPTHLGRSSDSSPLPNKQPGFFPRDTVHFQIWDTGIGINETDQKRLFAPFAQIDSSLSRKYQGTGLGLVITRKLAELHGGTVSLESSPNQGARFTISLPLQKGG